MRGILVGTIGLAMIGFASPSIAQSSCGTALAALGHQWDALGFAAPQKPSQAYVYGAGGRVMSGVDYQRITGELRFAAQDCANGRETAAMQRIQSIQAALAPSHNG